MINDVNVIIGTYWFFAEQQNGSQVFEGQRGGREAWMQQEDPRFVNTPPDGQFPMQNGGHVKFEVPKVPVIFVLGKEHIYIIFILYKRLRWIFWPKWLGMGS